MSAIDGLNTQGLLNLKNSLNPASKLFNWNTLVKELDGIGIPVDSDTKSLLVAGDPEI